MKWTEWNNRRLIIVNIKRYSHMTVSSWMRLSRQGKWCGKVTRRKIKAYKWRLRKRICIQRQPFLQSGSKVLCVSDLLLLGRATIEEAHSLLHWLDCEEGYGKMGVYGLSMGGVHAPMVLSLHPTPVATFSSLSPQSAIVAFCEGVLKHAMALDLYIMMQ
nr:hypothetical protein [Tanacetum cinerariifolium]